MMMFQLGLVECGTSSNWILVNNEQISLHLFRIHAGEFICCITKMPSDKSPSGEKEMKTNRKNKTKTQRKTVDIQQLTSSGHRALQEGQPQDALTFFKDALKAAAQLQDSRVIKACSFNLGAAYVEAGRPQKGLDFLQQAEPGPKADRLPDLQFNLALAHKALGQNKEAAAYFLLAAQLYRSQGDGRNEGDACMEMSHCYSSTQNWSQAVQGFLRAAEGYKLAAMFDSAATALKEAGCHMIQSDQFSQDDITSVLTECQNFLENITDQNILGELYLSVGVSYCQLRCFEEAVLCFNLALGPAAQSPPLLAKVLQNLGAAQNALGQFGPAVDHHRLAAGLYGTLGCRSDQARCFSNMAFAYSQLGDEEEAAESFILALQGFRDTRDHLAQVQVCEALAECYLKQKKQQKAVELYKQALSTLRLCQEAEGVQDRLVEQLTQALQQSLTVPQRPHPLSPHLHNSPVAQHARKSDIIQRLASAANQKSDKQRGDVTAGCTGETLSGEQKASEHSHSAGGGAAETPDSMNVTSGFRSFHQKDKPHHSERSLDRENPPTGSEASLAQQVEATPKSTGGKWKAPSPISRWRSQFCSLM
nr:tetratricopeptide repeat protein 24 isoform X2 [Nothobranchius furzeri]